MHGNSLQTGKRKNDVTGTSTTTGVNDTIVRLDGKNSLDDTFKKIRETGTLPQFCV